MIRKATISDLPALKIMAKKFHSASNFKSLEFDEDNMNRILEDAVSEIYYNQYILLVADIGEGVKSGSGFVSGAILANVWEMPHSKSSVAVDIAFVSLVKGKGIGKALVGAYVDECKRIHAKPMLGVNMGLNNAVGYALLQKCGFAEIGRTFMYSE